MIKTINNMSQTFLFHTTPPPSYWVDSLETTTYLINIFPIKTLINIAPAEVLFRKIPSYDHFRIFGCLCNPKLSATAKHKLAHRSTPCVFLGYPLNHRGYNCLDMSSNKTIVARATFDETTFPYGNFGNLPIPLLIPMSPTLCFHPLDCTMPYQAHLTPTAHRLSPQVVLASLIHGLNVGMRNPPQLVNGPWS